MLSKEIGHFVQRAFLHEMQQIDLSFYDFQNNIPENELRKEMSHVADEDSYLDTFVEEWQSGNLYYDYRETKKVLEMSFINSLGGNTEWVRAVHVWEAFANWSKDKCIDSRNCRNINQLSMKLISRQLLGPLDERSMNTPIWRKKGAGNQRWYCCINTA